MSGTRTRTVRRTWTPDDRREQLYRYVDFEVPFATPSVAVSVDYDRGRGTVDLGLFDPGGFRGYSGGARDAFVVAATGATPGYLPGPVTAGTWRVLLGLYALPDDGLDVEVTIRLDGRRPPPAAPRPAINGRARVGRGLPAPAGHRWAPGDLHCHTTHSDGALALPALVAEARASGLEILAVSDHNTVSHHARLPRLARWSGLVLVPAQEVTTPWGHATCLGDVGWVDFREPAPRWLAHSRHAGGLLSVNHPLVPGMGWQWSLPDAPDLVELWHVTWDRRSDAPLRWWRETGGVPVGGSDFHDPGQGRSLGHPTTWVLVPDGADPARVLGALTAGSVAVSASPDGPVLVRVDGELVAVGADGAELVGPGGAAGRIRGHRARLGAREGLHRLVDDAGRTLALAP